MSDASADMGYLVLDSQAIPAMITSDGSVVR